MNVMTDGPRLQRYARIALFSAATFAFIMAVTPSPPHLPGEPSDKVMHMLAFAALGSLAAYGHPKRGILALLLWLTAFGGLIELVQAIPELHRDSDIMDLIADSIAALFALSAVRLAVNSRRFPQSWK